MTAEDIQNKITELLERLDALTPKWAKSKADFNYSNEMKKVILNMQKAKSESKSGNKREEDAYASDEYTKYLWKAFNVDVEYYSLEGQKSLIEKELDCLRSQLSFSKTMINLTT